MRRLARAVWFSALVPSVALATDPPPPQAPAPAAAASDEDDDVAAKPAPPAGAATPAAAATPIYQGVTLGSDRLPPRAKPNHPGKPGPARLTWIGFQRREGVPTVFVQLDRPVAWSLEQSDGKLVYTLVGATVPIPNNRRKLDAKEFGTPVQTVEARKKGRDVEVTISVKGKVAHTEKNEDGPGGYKFLVIGIPQG